MSVKELYPSQQVDPELMGNTIKIYNDLASRPEFHTDALKPYKVQEVERPINQKIMATAYNNRERVYQDLRGVIKAQWELFGIIEVQIVHTNKRHSPIESKLAISHFRPGQRAELIGFLETDKPLVIGRNYQEQLDAHTSREHFEIALSKDGTIGIADLDSANGTVLVTAHEKPKSKNILSELNTWSIKSSELK